MAKKYIEREAAIESINHEDPAFAYAIERVPAADVSPVVRGMWIDKNAGNATCSVCNRRHRDVYDDDASDLFCRSCGAKMEADMREDG